MKGWIKKFEKEGEIITWYNPKEKYAIRLIDRSDSVSYSVEWGSYEHKRLDEDWIAEIKSFPNKKSALMFIYKFIRKF